MVNHFADAFSTEPGRCWRFVSVAGRPTACKEPVVWMGRHKDKFGKTYQVYSCDGHCEGLDGPRLFVRHAHVS